MKRILSFLIAVLLIPLSCSKIEVFHSGQEDCTISRELFDDIQIVKDNILFSNIPGITDTFHTKSSDYEEMTCLSSLLDWEKTDTCHFKDKIITQIAFLPDDGKESVSLIDTLRDEILGGDISIVKKFLVSIEEVSIAVRDYFVVTMIPTAECINLFGDDSFSFIDKSVFEGIVLYSELDGTFSDVYIYRDGPMSYGSFTEAGTASDYEELLYLRLFKKGQDTRSSSRYDDADGGEITGSICIGVLEPEEMFSISEKYNNDYSNWRKGGGGGGSKGGGNVNIGNNGNYKKDKDSINDTLKPSRIIDFRKEPFKFKVCLSLQGKGMVRGGGIYPKGRFATCEAIPNTACVFDRWTGDFYGEPETVHIVVNSDISATAYFSKHPLERQDIVRRPCFDLKKGLGNPLINMNVAAPSPWSGYRGGTFGYVRNGGKKFHSGIDLAASVGTEAYAMIDGVIQGGGKNYITEQPNKYDGEYPIGYNGDENGAGNRINLVGVFEGKEVRIGYWHLQAGAPVAINPRTGKPFAPGDRVYRGEAICYTGITGNAFDVPTPHLHLSYYEKNEKGKYVSANPEKLINGEVDWDAMMKKVLSGDIKDIICDDEPQDKFKLFY